ncbi:MAG: CopG family transcriptional regulator [Myxococcaceae bacterium]
MSRLKTLTVKVPKSLSARVARLAKSKGATQSEVIREALEAYTQSEHPSFTASAAEFCGAAEGPGDLSTNPRYMEGFGE